MCNIRALRSLALKTHKTDIDISLPGLEETNYWSLSQEERLSSRPSSTTACNEYANNEKAMNTNNTMK